MSVSNEKTLWCDSCVEWYQTGCTKVGTLRREARQLGWTYKKKRDYCPECSEGLRKQTNG